VGLNGSAVVVSIAEATLVTVPECESTGGLFEAAECNRCHCNPLCSLRGSVFRSTIYRECPNRASNGVKKLSLVDSLTTCMEKWIKTAKSLIGTKEVPGAKSNPTIIGWAKALGNKALGMAYNEDGTPWCGLFVAHCVKEAGLTPAPIAVRTSAWATWGVACKPVVGAVVVFQRPGGGHVGFLVGQNATAYRVLGGNQSDGVNETWIEKSRAVAVRWPAGVPVSTEVLPWLNAKGAVSKNEA